MANTTSRQTTKKRRTHDRILTAAGRIVRKNGLAAASVSRVMRGAGLTIGGFYAHFRSKRAMDAEVVQATLGGSSSPWSVDRYLTAAHRDHPERGCAFPAMLSEVARADEPTRMALARAIDARARELAGATPGGRRGAAARQRALATLALCVGGLTLSRAMRGHPASDEVLAACRKWALADRRPARRKAGR